MAALIWSAFFILFNLNALICYFIHRIIFITTD